MKLTKIDSLSAIQSFTVTSGALRVTDPCYGLDVWCSGQVENVLNGPWKARVGYHKDEFDIKHCVEGIAEIEEKIKNETNEFLREFHHRRDLNLYKENLEKYVGRVAYIHIAHESAAHELDTFHLATYTALEINVGVDSGQAGFFDLAHYTDALSDKSNGGREKGTKFDTFYHRVCDLTCETRESFGVVEFGAVSSSGYGDGGYTCFVKTNANDKIVAAIIIFITEGEDE